jgi:hypothetical protein
MTSSFRALVFTAHQPGKEWVASGHDMTLIVRRTETGFVGFIKRWSATANTLVIESISTNGQLTIYPTIEEAENACQKRYEQEVRWKYTRSGQ